MRQMNKNKEFNTDVMVNDYNYTKDVRAWTKKHGNKRYVGKQHIPKWFRPMRKR